MYPRIRNLREDNDFTQKFVANLLSFSHANYAKIERGEVALMADVLVQFSKLYNVSIDYLLGLTDYPYRLKKKKWSLLFVH
ncbi:helix-turn-helix family protein [Streptococcus pyogenes]|uniref:helix-turn-helix domain-containing protein n=1 Tax=Streptococcus pyogenes TaxID=1314 RepID=UPI0010A13ABE|nr:helix-turn-helix transcriptional regulator [Streptococcus pyogenes]VGR60991.1 helix-turn-helix family protein [Streptococcus pyogenes]VGR64583.1 helix-turn-helix family protein [Streptococcus pyogenes]VGR80738.1 helix-turn-helix family protein [Streptococcus pyogenes]VGU25677.1 helix-turn-helix family protein [Streptococcus pyogenes]VGW77957.1 helix-turn-helix family protein [Streptococcus pyogenes]